MPDGIITARLSGKLAIPRGINEYFSDEGFPSTVTLGDHCCNLTFMNHRSDHTGIQPHVDTDFGAQPIQDVFHSLNIVCVLASSRPWKMTVMGLEACSDLLHDATFSDGVEYNAQLASGPGPTQTAFAFYDQSLGTVSRRGEARADTRRSPSAHDDIILSCHRHAAARLIYGHGLLFLLFLSHLAGWASVLRSLWPHAVL